MTSGTLALLCVVVGRISLERGDTAIGWILIASAVFETIDYVVRRFVKEETP